MASKSDTYLQVITCYMETPRSSTGLLFTFNIILIAINHCYCYYCVMIINKNILLMQVINANILQPKGKFYNMVSI